MKLPNIKKTLAILGALFTGGIGIALIGLTPHSAEGYAVN
jgi:hypothetical protein